MACIYVVEDDQNIREIEAFALKNAGYDVLDVDCARAFYEKLNARTPDLVVLDVMLPDEDGLSIVKKLRTESATRDVPVIMVTAKSSEIDTVKGLDFGADDYITKPFGVMELISRVKALLRRSGQESKGKTLSYGMIELDEEKRMVYVDGQSCELTYKEYELLRLLMLHAGKVTPREMILDRVWGTDFEGESRSLDMHIRTLRRKLGEAGAMIKTVRSVGYRINDE